MGDEERNLVWEDFLEGARFRGEDVEDFQVIKSRHRMTSGGMARMFTLSYHDGRSQRSAIICLLSALSVIRSISDSVVIRFVNH